MVLSDFISFKKVASSFQFSVRGFVLGLFADAMTVVSARIR